MRLLTYHGTVGIKALSLWKKSVCCRIGRDFSTSYHAVRWQQPIAAILVGHFPHQGDPQRSMEEGHTQEVAVMVYVGLW